ncbi:MAG: hypothetical protein QOG45_1428, partial [Chloroflexota bacterium]|nr:hypothetical protein [Chloroflexota bacterium]
MVGRLAVPDGKGTRPAVLIAPEANGLDEHQRSRAERLAELGYVALALDYHGGGRVYSERVEMMVGIGALGSDLDGLRGVGRAGLDARLAVPWADASRVG